MVTSYDIWQVVTNAIQETKIVMLSYRKQNGEIVSHQVVPIDILVRMRTDGRRVEYLFGHRLDFPFRERGGRTERSFLLEKILAIRATEHRFHPTEYVDLTSTQPRWFIPRKWAEQIKKVA
ncbi:MAG: hypothetical protein HY282_10180 [Nitrospirae bacterium]|nr:hypothetical protein [Candidatus Manganitrophaceae bacterium]